ARPNLPWPWPAVVNPIVLQILRQKERSDMDNSEQEQAGWERLRVPVPPRLAELIGYCGTARWVAFRWEPCGDESFFADGRSCGTVSPWPYLAFVRHAVVARRLAPFNLGSSDLEATETLVLDRTEQVLYAAPVSSARRFLVGQHPPTPELTPEEHAAVLERFDSRMRELRERPVRVSPAEVERAMREEQQAIAEMVAFLAAQVK